MKKLSEKKMVSTILNNRKDKGITQQELASITGINRSMISRLEKNNYIPTIEQLQTIAEALDFEVVDLFEEEENSSAATIDRKYNIAIAGTGYVGLSIATLLAQHNQVTCVDILPERVEKINNGQSTIQDDYIEKYLAEKNLNISATLDGETAYKDAEFVIIAAPTNYDSQKNFFDCSAVESVIELVLKSNPNAMMVIKSTIPVGYTESVREKYNTKNIIFSPEFLRESKALYDNLYPSRIIVSCDNDSRSKAETFASLLQQGAIKQDVDKLFMGFTEAEAVKLFAKYIPGSPGVLLQRAGHLRRNEGSQHAGNNQGCVSGSKNRRSLQQSLLRIRWILPAKGHKAASGKLRRCTTGDDNCNCTVQQNKKRLYRRSGAGNGGLLRLFK